MCFRLLVGSAAWSWSGGLRGRRRLNFIISVAMRCITGAGSLVAASTIARCSASAAMPQRIAPCPGMPITSRDMWCMPAVGSNLLDANSIDASGPTPWRRNGSAVGRAP